jgi:hypothetical protein
VIFAVAKNREGSLFLVWLFNIVGTAASSASRGRLIDLGSPRQCRGIRESGR